MKYRVVQDGKPPVRAISRDDAFDKAQIGAADGGKAIAQVKNKFGRWQTIGWIERGKSQ